MSAVRVPAAVLIYAALAWGAVSVSATAPQSNTREERFSANALNISNVGRSGAFPVDITISRWTTDAENERLMSIFKEKGQEALVKALQKSPSVGRLGSPGALSYDLRYARQKPAEEGGRKISLTTDRPIEGWEVSSSSRTLDYPFTMIELTVDRDGKGSGQLSIASKMTLLGDVLAIEELSDTPIRLEGVRKTK
jgi:hypothetical protein